MLHRPFSILIVACSCVGFACSSGVAHRAGRAPVTSREGGTKSTGGSAVSGAEARPDGIATGGPLTSEPVRPPKILWSDSIQTKPSPWGFNGVAVQHPVGPEVEPNDANGANLSVVPDPLGGPGLAMRHFATFDAVGSRSQAGIYGDFNTIYAEQAKKPEGVWIAQEWYFPQAIGAQGEEYCWISLWDFHAIVADRSSRWATAPGIFLAQDGSMRVRFGWGIPPEIGNKTTAWSGVPLPVGRWFDVEMHYVWTDTPTGTIMLWIDGQLAVAESGVQTRAPGHQVPETYMKFYGSTQGRGAWTPTPTLKYTRNVRIAGERIWRPQN
jgi:hypothetical protein